MIRFNNLKEFSEIRFNNSVISSILLGTKKIWEYVKSCFGRGFWLNDIPWSNSDPWNNNT